MSFLFRRAPERRRRACRSSRRRSPKARARACAIRATRRCARHLDAQTGRTLRLLTERGGTARAADFTLAHTPGVEAGLMIDALCAGHDGRALATRLTAFGR